MEEQQRIANLLKAQVSLCIELENAMESLQKMKHSKLLSEFGSYISPREDWHRLADYCEYVGDGTHFPPPFTESGVPFLLVSNISSGKLDSNIARWITEEAYQELIKSFRPSHGDILFSLVGSYGIPVYVNWDWDFSFQRHIGIIRADQKRMRGKYLFNFLQSPPAHRQANQCAEGLAQKTITLKSLRSSRLLTGTPDYMIAKRSELGKTVLAKPFVIVVEAKRNDFEQGWAQCLAELVAVQKLNGESYRPVHGIVTDGKLWEFGKLIETTFVKNIESYTVDHLSHPCDVLNFIFQATLGVNPITNGVTT